MRASCVLAVVLYLLVAPMAQPGFSQVEIDKAAASDHEFLQQRKISDLAAKVGPQVIRQWRRDTEDGDKNVDVDASDLVRSVEKAHEDYRHFIRDYQSVPTYSESLLVLAGGLFGGAVGMVSGPPGMLLGSVIGATAGNILADSLEETGRSLARQLLLKNRDDLLAAANRTYDELAADPEALRDVISKHTSLFRDLREKAEGDPVLWGFAVDLLTDTMANTTEAQLDAAANETENTERIDGELLKFAESLQTMDESLSERLDETTKSLGNINATMHDLQNSFTELESQLDGIEAGQAVIASFIFDSMSADQKIEMLKRGYMDHLLKCPDEVTDCSVGRVKTRMISSLEEEGKLKKQMSELAEAIDAVRDVHAIAANLGIDSPELNEILSYGTAAGGAVVQYLQQDYLGAIATMTGVFGQRAADPDTERFKFLMEYLGPAVCANRL